MKKSLENYNSIVPLKKSNNSEQIYIKNKSESEYNFQNIIKKHIIFKTKLVNKVASNEKPVEVSKLSTKRPISEKTDDLELNCQLNNLKKRYKLKAIELFDQSFDQEDESDSQDSINRLNLNVFDMSNSLEKSPTNISTSLSTQASSHLSNKKIFKKKSNDSIIMDKCAPLGQKSLKTNMNEAEAPIALISSKEEKKYFALKCDNSDDDEIECIQKLKMTKQDTSKPATEATAPKEIKKFFSVKCSLNDLDDEDLDDSGNTKKLVFKKKPSNTNNLLTEDKKLEETKPESVSPLTEASKPGKRKIFNSKRNNEEAKTMQIFNLNSYMDETNYEINEDNKQLTLMLNTGMCCTVVALFFSHLF